MYVMNKILILITVFSLFPSIVFAINIDRKAGTTGFNFLKIGIGARPIAMGGAFVGISDDINSLYWNPAGIAQLMSKEITFTHTLWLESINYSFLGFVYPLRKRTIGVSLAYLDSGKIQGYNEDDKPTEPFSASDLAFGISYGQSINERLLVGITLKVIHERLEKESVTAYVGDIGGVYKITKNVLLGAGVQNIGPEVSFVKEKISMPIIFKLGCGVKLLDKKLTLGLDIDKPIDYDLKVNFGAEYWLMRIISFRAGYQIKRNDYDGLANISAGLGFKYSLVAIDYAFVPYGNLGITHRVSLSLKF